MNLDEVNKIIEQPYSTWPIKVLGFVPNERSMPAPSKVLPSLFHYARQGLSFINIDYGRTDVVRNKAALGLLANPQFDYILMLDTDHAHDPDILQLLCRWPLLNPDIRVVGGLNFQRNEPFHPAFHEYDEQGKKLISITWPDTLFPVDVCGTGSLLIHRSVFTDIDANCAWFRFEYDGADKDYWPGEDVYFARLCKENGIQQYVDPECRSPHLHEQLIGEEEFRRHFCEKGLGNNFGAIR